MKYIEIILGIVEVVEQMLLNLQILSLNLIQNLSKYMEWFWILRGYFTEFAGIFWLFPTYCSAVSQNVHSFCQKLITSWPHYSSKKS